jgi:type I restriction enzyme S subunit
MDTQTFLDNFRHIADASNGVQKLREMILELAVKGKLTSQVSLGKTTEEISNNFERQRLNLEKKYGIKPRKKGDRINVAEIPFEIPRTWRWFRLSEVGHEWGQKKPNNTFTYIDVSAIDNARGVISDETSALNAASAPSRARKLVKNGTVIYSTVRPYLLNIAVVDRDFSPEPIVSTAFAVLHPYDGLDGRYLYHYLRSSPFVEYVEAQMTGMAYPAINDSKFFQGLIPVPPLEEQKRIVVNVGQLMDLCDQLETQQKQKDKIRIAINNAALDKLLTSQTPDEFNQNWKRINNNIHHLYDNLENLTKLRVTIHKLSVRGLLVKQDRNEESAESAIHRAMKKRAELVRLNKIKKLNELPRIYTDYLNFSLPNGWYWARMPEAVANDKYAIKRGPFGSDIKKGYFVPSGYKVYEQKNAIYDDFSLGNYYINDMKFEELKAFEVKPNDIIISCSGTVGRVAIAPGNMELGIINQALLKLTLNNEVLLNEYFKLLFSAYFMETETLSDLKGTAQKNIVSVEILKTLPFPLPPLAEQKRIVAKVDQLMALCDQLESQIKQAQTTQHKLTEATIKSLAA